MSVSKAGLRDALPAGADLTNSLFRFAKITSTGTLVVCDTAGEQVYGAISEGAAQDRGATVDLDGIVKVIAGATVATGARVTTNNAGAAVTAAAGSIVFGIARKGGAAGAILEITRVSGAVAA